MEYEKLFVEFWEKITRQAIREIHEEINERPKEWTGSRAKKEKEHKTKPIAARLPLEIVEELMKRKGSITQHIEVALRLYLRVLHIDEK
jgi:hypothetical protein